MMKVMFISSRRSICVGGSLIVPKRLIKQFLTFLKNKYTHIKIYEQNLYGKLNNLNVERKE